jgi:prepilin-type N-terminal cleavage/methylation domain-containing protein
MKFKTGFTLIEMSIVLAIIGALIGGILVGKDLIHAAEIRATIGQYDEFNNATNAFKLKYNCLPGDCSHVIDFGFDPASAGNGDGLIGFCFVTADAHCAWNNWSSTEVLEQYNYWYQLSAAGFIPYHFSVITALPTYPLVILGQSSPPAKIRAFHGADSNYANANGGWWVQGDILYDTNAGGGEVRGHAFLLSTVAAVPTVGFAWAITAPGGYLAGDAYAIDDKLDNGLPTSGSVRVWSGFDQAAGDGNMYLTIVPANLGGNCIHTDAMGITRYSIDNVNTVETTGLCNLAIQAAF